MKKSRLMTGSAGALLALALPAACDDGTGPGAGGAVDERGAVDAYVAALNASDPAALAALAPPGNEADAEAEARVRASGGRALEVTKVDIAHDFGPDVATAALAATDRHGQRYGERLTLTRHGRTWFVALGENPRGHDKLPASTTKP
ncbi:hypothetical protein [Streptomyces tritici]|uniref:hypothetical protein n=1 Tax=Streptomyces tritici TaxID=2054410 RepID=UPI003AF0ECAC